MSKTTLQAPLPQTPAPLKTRIAIPFITAILCVFLVIEPAHATVFDNFADTILEILNNDFIRMLAIVAVIVSGLMALSGRMEWLRFGYVLLGIVIVFGAAGIVDFIADGSATTY